MDDAVRDVLSLLLGLSGSGLMISVLIRFIRSARTGLR